MSRLRVFLVVFSLVIVASAVSAAGTTWSIFQDVISNNTLRVMVPPGTVPPGLANHGCGLLWVIDESTSGSTEINTSIGLRYGATTTTTRLTGLTFTLQPDGSVTVQRTGAGNPNTYNVLVELRCV